MKSSIINKAIYLIKRFPVPIIFSLLFCLETMMITGGHNHYSDLLSLSWCGCFLFISLKLYSESHHLNLWKYYSLGFLGLVFVWYFFYFQSVFPTIGFFLSMFIAPFLFKKDPTDNLWRFAYHLWGQIFLTILVSAAIFLCALFIKFLLMFLLGFQFNPLIDIDLFIIVSTVFAPIMSMYGIPAIDHLKDKAYPKMLLSIMIHVFLPFLLIYGMILYLYIAKILILWSLPKGQVCYLVAIFGSLMISAYLIIYPVRYSNKIFSFYNRHLFKMLLPPLILMSVGIGVRVVEFGLTESRYFMILLLAWLALSSCFSLSKKNQEIPKFILTSLVVLLIGGSFGPWNAVELSGYSQLQKLEAIIKNKRVELDKLSAYPWELTDQDGTDIERIIEYLVNSGKIKQLTQKADLLRAIEELIQTAGIFETDRKERFEYLAKRWNDLLMQSGSVPAKGD